MLLRSDSRCIALVSVRNTTILEVAGLVLESSHSGIGCRRSQERLATAVTVATCAKRQGRDNLKRPWLRIQQHTCKSG